jgi:hypothetical protein
MVLRPPTLVSQKRPHQTLVQRLQRNDVLSIPKDDAAEHAADGFPDDGERVMPDFLRRYQRSPWRKLGNHCVPPRFVAGE